MKEHGYMINLLKNIEEELDEGKTSNVEPLRVILDKHHHFEDDVFYPKLEEMLDENQKREIKFRINDFLKG
jgi:hemerythrin superfamily protein